MAATVLIFLVAGFLVWKVKDLFHPEIASESVKTETAMDTSTYDLSLIHISSYRKKIREDVKTAEQGMKRVLTEMAEYLEERKSSEDVWVDLDDLEEVLHDGLRHAHEQVDNTLGEEDYYYADYLERRLQQCSMLQTLRNSVIRIRKVPKQAVYVARYLEYLSECSAEKDSPEEQLWKLEDVLDQMNLEALRCV